MVDGKLYALNIGSNSQVIVHNTRVFKEAGVDVDLINWTWMILPRLANRSPRRAAAR